LCDSPSAKAAVLTNLARALCEKPDGLTEAERRLDEALDLDPNHLPAVVTMATSCIARSSGIGPSAD